MLTTKRVNNKKNKKNKNKNQKNKNNNQSHNAINDNDICTTSSVMEYNQELANILCELDIIYTDTILSFNTTIYNNEIFKQTFIKVFKRKSQNPEHLNQAELYAQIYNNEIQYWNANGRTNSYFNNFNRIFYNKNQLNNKKAIYPFTFEQLIKLYNKYNVYAEVVFMISELLPSKIEFSRNVLFGRVKKGVNLGPLKENIEIPLTEEPLNLYSYFIVIMASNGVVAYSRPFSLNCRDFESNDNLLKLFL